MSLDSLQPIAPAIVTATQSALYIRFARFPDRDLIEEMLATFARKPGFAFGQGVAVNGKVLGASENPNPLEYTAAFPSAYSPIDVAKAVQDILARHGVSSQLEIAPSVFKKMQQSPAERSCTSITIKTSSRLNAYTIVGFLIDHFASTVVQIKISDRPEGMIVEANISTPDNIFLKVEFERCQAWLLRHGVECEILSSHAS